MARAYLFVDEWEVAAPPETVYWVVADARTYPDWWRPVYQAVEGDDPPAVGTVTRHRFKGRLPYVLTMRAEMVAMEPPRTFDVEVGGDLRGHGRWTFTPSGGGTRPLGLGGVRGPAAPPLPVPGPAPALPLEPPVGRPARDGAARAVRAGARGRELTTHAFRPPPAGRYENGKKRPGGRPVHPPGGEPRMHLNRTWEVHQRKKDEMPAVELELELDMEAELVRNWRLEELERAGYPRDAAEQLADLGHVDLHLATGLLRRGCPAETALRILF